MARQLRQNIQQTIDTPHQNIHDGLMFEASWKSPDASPIADNGVFGLLIQTGQLEPNLTFELACGGDLEIRLWRNATFSASGTVVNSYNLDHSSGNTPTAIVRHSPTLITGTLITNIFQPGGVGPQAAGGTASHNIEREFKPNTAYYLQGINRSGNNQPASALIYWYEDGT